MNKGTFEGANRPSTDIDQADAVGAIVPGIGISDDNYLLCDGVSTSSNSNAQLSAKYAKITPIERSITPNNIIALSDIAYGSGKYCVIGNSGTTAATSTDGITWTLRTLPTSAQWQAITWTGSVFYTVSAKAPTAISTDGITWTARTMAASGSVYGSIIDVIHNGTKFVVLVTGINPMVFNYHSGFYAYSSTDGTTWSGASVIPSNSEPDWAKFQYGASVHCAISGNTIESLSAATSTDALTWTARTLPVSAKWTDIVFGGSNFCAVAQGPSSIAAISTNGITWTQQTLPSSQQWSCIAYGASVYCTLARDTNIAATSTDGITWTVRTLSATFSWNRVIWTGSVFFAIGVTTPIATTSTDGITWTAATINLGNNSYTWADVCTDNFDKKLINSLYTVDFYSTDNTTWSNRTLPVGTWISVASNGTSTIAIASGNTLRKNLLWYDTSINIWIEINEPTFTRSVRNSCTGGYSSTGAATKIRFANSLYFLLLYSQGWVSISTNGISWTINKNALTTNTWIDVVYGNGVYLTIAGVWPSVGGSSISTEAATSTDGITWTPRTMPTVPVGQAGSGASWTAVAWNGTVFCAVSTGATQSSGAATSTDGITWVLRTLPAQASWAVIKWNGTIFLALTSGTVAGSSTDGITWALRTAPTNNARYSLAVKDSVFCTLTINSPVSSNTTTDGITWTTNNLPARIIQCIDLTYNGTVFTTFSNATNYDVANSTDGITWTSKIIEFTQPFDSCASKPNGVDVVFSASQAAYYSSYQNLQVSPTYNWSKIQYANNQFCLIATNDTVSFVSTVGTLPPYLIWTAGSLPSASSWIGLAYGSGVWCAIANNASSAIAATSTDGITWTARTLPFTGTWNDIAFGASGFVAVASGTANYGYSLDGITWVTKSFGTSQTWTKVKWTGRMFVAIASSYSKVALSTDGLSWIFRELPTNRAWSVLSGDVAEHPLMLAPNVNSLMDLNIDPTTVQAPLLPSSQQPVQNYLRLK